MRLEPGSPAPDFTLSDQDGSPVTLASFRGSKVIVFFYPQAMTLGCTRQACDFRDSMGALTAAGYTVLGISRDAPETLREFRARDGLDYALLSDPDHAVHERYGAWGEKVNYGKVIDGVIRSTFVIDEEGVLTQALYNVRATGHVGRLRRILGLD